MSRVGKKPIPIPDNVEVKIEGQKVDIRGPKGELSFEIRPEILVEVREREIIIAPALSYAATTGSETTGLQGINLKAAKNVPALWGLTRSLIANMVKGVTEGYAKKLELVGIGYRVALEGNDLVLNVGFTHPVKIKAKAGIKFSVDKNIVTVAGINKELVGQAAAEIRRIRKPEPYKGKGIRYLGEVVRKKLGKKAATAAGAA